MSDSSQYSTQYTYHIAEESDGNEDDNYVLSEVELKPPSVGDLLKSYSETVGLLVKDNIRSIREPDIGSCHARYVIRVT